MLFREVRVMEIKCASVESFKHLLAALGENSFNIRCCLHHTLATSAIT